VLTGSGAEMANHARGICSTCTADGYAQICVGSAAGSIFVITYDGENFHTSTTLQAGSSPPVSVSSPSLKCGVRSGRC